MPKDLLADSVSFLPLKEQQESRLISKLFNKLPGCTISDVRLLHQTVANINHRNFNDRAKEIERLHNKCKLNGLYRKKLPKLIQTASQNDSDNFNELMIILNIKPITIHDIDMNSNQFQTGDVFTKLLILSSRAIIHSFGFPIQPQIEQTNPWFISGYKIETILDIFKIIFNYAFDYVFHLEINDSNNISKLMDHHNLIPWHSEIVHTVQTWDFCGLIKCYEDLMQVLYPILNMSYLQKTDVLRMDSIFLFVACHRNHLSLCEDTVQTQQVITFMKNTALYVYESEKVYILENIIIPLHENNGKEFLKELLVFNMYEDNGYYSTLFDILIQSSEDNIYEYNFFVDDYIKSKFELYHICKNNDIEIMQDEFLKRLVSMPIWYEPILSAADLENEYHVALSVDLLDIWEQVIEGRL